MKTFYERIVKNSSWLFVISGIVLTTLLTTNYAIYLKYNEYNGYRAGTYDISAKYIFIAFILSIGIYLFLEIRKKFAKNVLEKSNTKMMLIAAFFSLACGYRLILDLEINSQKIIDKLCDKIRFIPWENFWVEIQTPLFWSLCIVSLFALFVFFMFFIENAYIIVKDVYYNFLKIDLYFLIVSFTFCIFLIFIYYQTSFGAWNSLDVVYQSDTTFIYNNYYGTFSFGYNYDYDIGIGGIRHPLATLYMYPINVIALILEKFLFFIPYIRPIFLACIQSLCMIFSVILIKKMVNSNWIYVLFPISYPFLVYIIILEKYQLSILFMIAFGYCYYRKLENDVSGTMLISGSGMMITSSLVGFFYGKEKKFHKRLLEYVSIGLYFFASVILSGRINYILNFPYLRSHHAAQFESFDVGGLWEKFCSFLCLMKSSFIPIPYENNELFIQWKGENFTLFGLIVFWVVILGIVKNIKQRDTQFFAFWVGFSFVFVVFIGYGVGCIPLFALYFSWAIVPLFIKGINSIIKKDVIKNVVYSILALMMIYTNYQQMVFLYYALIQKTPV